ncbi:MAG: LysR family transcriptional regulator [Chloroflexi bacterium]|nr:MAG: LysR family transcriptional regulator [Chloroflexota bacterium]
MEIGQLEAFERAARDGSFTRAAESLGLTQPAVSTRITILEAELGGALFERRGRQLQLTPLGEHFLPYAQRILAVMNDGLQAVRHFQAGRIGQIKIAAPTPFILSFLVDALADFRQQHPTVDVLIRERDKRTIFDLLHDNVMMLGLVNAPVFDQHMTQLLRLQDPIRAVVAADHPLAAHHQSHDTLMMSDIYQHTIFRVSMFPRMSAFIDEVVEQGRVGSGGAVIAVPMVMALRLVRLSKGVTFLPESYVRHPVETGQLVFLDIADMPRLMSEPVLIAQRGRALNSVHQEFVRIFKARWRHLLVT